MHLNRPAKLMTQNLFEFSFAVYSPDPYVTVQALGTPNGIKRTEHVKDSSDPRWDETLQFYIDPERDRLLGMYQKHIHFLHVGILKLFL